MNTTDVLLMFTSKGNYLHIPVHIIPDLKWKDMPKHVSNIIETSPDESIISAIPAYSFNSDNSIIIASKNGLIKRTKLKDFRLQRYSKATSCMNITSDDEVIKAFVEDKDYLFLTTDSGYGLSFNKEEVPIVGAKAKGVKAIKLKDDKLISINDYDLEKDEYISIITEKGTGKRIRLNEFDISSRARRGLQVIREVKTNPYKILKTFITDSRNFIGLKNADINNIKLTELPIADRYSTGSQISKHALTDAFLISVLTRRKALEEENKSEEKKVKEEVKPLPKKEQISLKEIDDRLMTIDDFLN